MTRAVMAKMKARKACYAIVKVQFYLARIEEQVRHISESTERIFAEGGVIGEKHSLVLKSVEFPI